MIRFRCGNAPASGGEWGGFSLITAPRSAISLGQFDVLRRIDVQHAAAQHGERSAAGLERPAMSGRVDAASQSADDGVARASQTRRPVVRPGRRP